MYPIIELECANLCMLRSVLKRERLNSESGWFTSWERWRARRASARAVSGGWAEIAWFGLARRYRGGWPICGNIRKSCGPSRANDVQRDLAKW